MGQAVVLEDDALFLLLEKPGDRPAHGVLAPEVLLPEERPHLAGPVDRGGDAADFFGLFLFAGSVGAGAVGGHIEPRGSGPPDFLEDAGGGVGSVEDEEEDGGFEEVLGHGRGKGPERRRSALPDSADKALPKRVGGLGGGEVVLAGGGGEEFSDEQLEAKFAGFCDGADLFVGAVTRAGAVGLCKRNILPLPVEPDPAEAFLRPVEPELDPEIPATPLSIDHPPRILRTNLLESLPKNGIHLRHGRFQQTRAVEIGDRGGERRKSSVHQKQNQYSKFLICILK